ncbi:hypothetical protein MCOR27_006292 [Pyricularia oryzae]|nr:hypothetical protein MCOR26_010211 [Pyricularia oryzae]KAI6276760.1 hypothetical protein MCOR27_006292 [Pyricularia oryzae]KAI6291424.1 hypothetical protein MCOR34_010177 [Pyricularia oryzae]KAI6306872.1 hypothetical protein MCOR29_009928 [Pyricularia oryzae]KAI6315896.1 hypothetical protein MCOR30_009537 [Pyricularia oryzae]
MYYDGLSYRDLMILIWVLWTIALFATLFRGISQYVLQRRLHADDYWAMSGFLCLTAMAALATTIMQKLFVAIDYFQATENDPFAALPLNLNELIDNMTASLKAMFASMIIFWTTIWTAKYSILFFVKRIVNGLPGYMQAWWACFTLVTMLYVACIVSLFMTCMPLQKYWTILGEPNCYGPNDINRAKGSLVFATVADIIADIAIMILPLNLLRKLMIPRGAKAGLVFIFSLGTIIIIFAFIRLAQAVSSMQQVSGDIKEATKTPIILSQWGFLECAVGIIVAMLPAFRFLFSKNRANASKANKGKWPGSSGAPSSGRSARKTDPAKGRSVATVEEDRTPICDKTDVEMGPMELRNVSSSSYGARGTSAGSSNHPIEEHGIRRTVEFGVAVTRLDEKSSPIGQMRPDWV